MRLCGSVIMPPVCGLAGRACMDRRRRSSGSVPTSFSSRARTACDQPLGLTAQSRCLKLISASRRRRRSRLIERMMHGAATVRLIDATNLFAIAVNADVARSLLRALREGNCASSRISRLYAARIAKCRGNYRNEVVVASTTRYIRCRPR